MRTGVRVASTSSPEAARSLVPATPAQPGPAIVHFLSHCITTPVPALLPLKEDQLVPTPLPDLRAFHPPRGHAILAPLPCHHK